MYKRVLFFFLTWLSFSAASQAQPAFKSSIYNEAGQVTAMDRFQLDSTELSHFLTAEKNGQIYYLATILESRLRAYKTQAVGNLLLSFHVGADGTFSQYKVEYNVGRLPSLNAIEAFLSQVSQSIGKYLAIPDKSPKYYLPLKFEVADTPQPFTFKEGWLVIQTQKAK